MEPFSFYDTRLVGCFICFVLALPNGVLCDETAWNIGFMIGTYGTFFIGPFCTNDGI